MSLRTSAAALVWQSVFLSLPLGEGGSRVSRKRETDEGNPREPLNHFRKSLCGRPLAARFFLPRPPIRTNPPRPTPSLFVAFRKKCVSKEDFCISLLDTDGNPCYNPAHIEITL